jgi:hypothetical protein
MNRSTPEFETDNADARQQVVSYGRAALVIAHPSHELRVHGWLELAQPKVFIWTDGSGRSGPPRLDWTTKILARTGATQGSIYGRLTDAAIYTAVLQRNYEVFINLVDELASEFVHEQIEYVVGDALEGHNVSHEVGRMMTGAAVEIATRMRGRAILNFDFVVVGPPDDCPQKVRSQALKLSLDDAFFKRKLAAATSHHPKLAADVNAALGGEPLLGIRRFADPELAIAATGEVGDMARLREYPELAAKILGLLQGVKLESFRKEYLRPIDNRAGTYGWTEEHPFFEVYGEKLVEGGHYQEVIRYREHLLPFADALWNHVERLQLSN